VIADFANSTGEPVFDDTKVSESRKAYDDFFAIMKDADANLPILLTARKEYSALGS